MAVVKYSYISVMLYRCLFVVFGIAERQLPKSCEENDLMNKRTLRRLFSVLIALVIGGLPADRLRNKNPPKM